MKGTLVTCSVPCLGTGPLPESTRGLNFRLGMLVGLVQFWPLIKLGSFKVNQRMSYLALKLFFSGFQY